jgi:DNA-binding IclR family transcriptional regulator
MATAEKGEKINAIEKSLRVLAYFAENNTPIGTTELSEQLNLNKTTISRIVNTLKREKFLEQNPLTKQYSLGPMVARLSKSITQSLDGQSSLIAQPYCDQLRDEVGETVHFEVLSGSHIYLAYAARGHNPVSVAITIGDRVYPHIHAGARCIAAYSHPRLVDKWLQADLPKYYEDTETDTEKIVAGYREITAKGLSIDDGLYNHGIYAIAVPVFDNNGRAAASVVIVAPHMRKHNLENESTVAAIKKTAKAISERLFCPQEYEELCRLYFANGGSIHAV